MGENGLLRFNCSGSSGSSGKSSSQSSLNPACSCRAKKDPFLSTLGSRSVGRRPIHNLIPPFLLFTAADDDTSVTVVGLKWKMEDKQNTTCVCLFTFKLRVSLIPHHLWWWSRRSSWMNSEGNLLWSTSSCCCCWPTFPRAAHQLKDENRIFFSIFLNRSLSLSLTHTHTHTTS